MLTLGVLLWCNKLDYSVHAGCISSAQKMHCFVCTSNCNGSQDRFFAIPSMNHVVALIHDWMNGALHPMQFYLNFLQFRSQVFCFRLKVLEWSGAFSSNWCNMLDFVHFLCCARSFWVKDIVLQHFWPCVCADGNTLVYTLGPLLRPKVSVVARWFAYHIYHGTKSPLSICRPEAPCILLCWYAPSSSPACFFAYSVCNDLISCAHNNASFHTGMLEILICEDHCIILQLSLSFCVLGGRVKSTRYLVS